MLNQSSPPTAASPAQNGQAENPTLSPNSSPDSRKTYLSLLPTEQLIEICLLFEPHVPLHIKTSVWPADLEVAILELRKNASARTQSQPHSDAAIDPTPTTNGTPQDPHVSPPAHPVHPPGHNVSPRPPDEDPPMGSLRDPTEEAKEKECVAAPASATGSPVPQAQANGNSSSSTTQATPGSHAATPQPQAQAQHATLHPPAPYPYAPYGYPLPPSQGQQPAYPHAPYYPPPPAYHSHYAYPHYSPPPGYPTPPPGHHPPPPHAHGNQPLFNANPLARPPSHPPTVVPQPPPPPPSEDLPSYEEMIVEALLDCGDVEGVAPKDLFTWMASRYPLQTNFRPSASQALQKAYKRGRLEKRAGGKYRLNPSWEGGATSKRTTRRPQTLAQTTYAMHHPPPPPSSPFTHAPLQHSQQHPPVPAQQQTYNGYSYQYPYSHYPGYPPPDQTRQPSQAPNSAPVQPSVENASATKVNEGKDDGGDSGDVWQAAQHILQAINFGRLTQNTNANSAPNASAGTSARPAASPSAPVSSPTNAADDAFSVVLNALSSAAAASNPEPSRTFLTDDERASLQAQLALLAAQLTELVDAEEDVPAPPPSAPSAAQSDSSKPPPQITQPMQSTQPAQPPSQPHPQPRPAHPETVGLPPPPTAAHLILDVNAFPEVFNPPKSRPASRHASGAQTEVSDLGGEDSDDDDMEDVVVPLHTVAGHDALRT